MWPGAPIVSTVGAETLSAEERVIVRMTAADPRSEWSHGLSVGLVSLTDRRIVFRPYAVHGPSAARNGVDRLRWELSLDDVDRITSTPVPLWLLGVVRIWLRGIRVATTAGRGKTFVLRGTQAADFVAAFDGLRKAKRRSDARADSAI
jgi:hypothetical protein